MSTEYEVKIIEDPPYENWKVLNEEVREVLLAWFKRPRRSPVANNRMWIVNTETLDCAFIGKHLGTEMYFHDGSVEKSLEAAYESAGPFGLESWVVAYEHGPNEELLDRALEQRRQRRERSA